MRSSPGHSPVPALSGREKEGHKQMFLATHELPTSLPAYEIQPRQIHWRAVPVLGTRSACVRDVPKCARMTPSGSQCSSLRTERTHGCTGQEHNCGHFTLRLPAHNGPEDGPGWAREQVQCMTGPKGDFLWFAPPPPSPGNKMCPKEELWADPPPS